MPIQTRPLAAPRFYPNCVAAHEHTSSLDSLRKGKEKREADSGATGRFPLLLRSLRNDGQRMLSFDLCFSRSRGLLSLLSLSSFFSPLKPSRSKSNRTHPMFDQTDMYAKLGHAKEEGALLFLKAKRKKEAKRRGKKKGFAVSLILFALSFFLSKSAKAKQVQTLGLCAISLLSFCLSMSRCSFPLDIGGAR